MSRRLAATVAALIAALAATGAAGASPPGPQARSDGYSPAQVQALADASPFFTLEAAPVRVTPAEAYAASTQPGATVSGSPLAAATSTTSICWEGATYSEQWGIWPVYQKVISHDSWCSTNWSHLYYHSNYVTTAQVSCSASTPFHDRVSGGVSGQMTDEWEVGARFSCPTSLPGVYYNPTRSFYIVVAADGGYYHG
jgi:hypothetical protein